MARRLSFRQPPRCEQKNRVADRRLGLFIPVSSYVYHGT